MLSSLLWNTSCWNLNQVDRNLQTTPKLSWIDHILRDFNYRERGALSPNKLMTQITRGRSANNSYCGHYIQSGTMWTETNLEFAQMLYGGLDGSPLIRGIMQPINIERVQTLFRLLQQLNPQLERYNNTHIQQELQNVVLRKLERLGEQPNLEEEAWAHSYIFTPNEVDPMQADHPLGDLLLGVESESNDEIDYKTMPNIIALLYPYLFTSGRGYYSLASPDDRTLTEEQGGYADANAFLTVSKWVKLLIFSADRRFGKCTEFLYFMLNFIEKKRSVLQIAS